MYWRISFIGKIEKWKLLQKQENRDVARKPRDAIVCITV